MGHHSKTKSMADGGAWRPKSGFGDSTGAGRTWRDSGRPSGGGGFNDRDRGGFGGDRGGGFSGFKRPEEEHQYGKTTVLPPAPEGWPRGVEWSLEAYRKMKEGKMSLTGVRQRSRKRDVKKYEPEIFAEEVIRIINENEDNLEKAFSLIQAGVND